MIKKQEKPEELIRAQQLIDDAKVNEAHDLLNNFEKKEGLTLHDKVYSHLLRADLLFQQGRHKEVVTLAEETYDMSLGLGKNLLSVDALMWMAVALIFLNRMDKAYDIIKQGEELLNALPQEVPADYKQREAFVALGKGRFYQRKGDGDKALEHFEHSLTLREEWGIKHEIAESLGWMAHILSVFKGELNRALKHAERSLALAKESSKKYYIARSLSHLAGVYWFQGGLDRSIILSEQSLAIFKELNNKRMMANMLNNLGDKYRMKGELDRALECLERSVALHQELGNTYNLAGVHDFFIQILIEMGDIERAQQALRDLEQLSTKLNNKTINSQYLLDKALVLKTSPRAIKRGKAEEILEQLLEDKDLKYELSIGALLNLCELLLIELRMTNDVEVLDEINPLIARLLDIAEKSNSYWILSEAYLLQAKLSLLTFDIKKAQGFLTQAQQIAENFGLNQLATKITSESDDLLKKLDLWEKLKESGAPMTDRFELARLDEKIIGIVYKHTDLTTKVTVEEVAISKEKKICLVCRGGVLRFSYICECGAIYCGNCAQALTNLENACWACDAPIDFLKPVKPYKEVEGRVEMGEKLKEN